MMPKEVNFNTSFTHMVVGDNIWSTLYLLSSVIASYLLKALSEMTLVFRVAEFNDVLSQEILEKNKTTSRTMYEFLQS